MRTATFGPPSPSASPILEAQTVITARSEVINVDVNSSATCFNPDAGPELRHCRRHKQATEVNFVTPNCQVRSPSRC
jgi:hypothetical protein